MNSDSRLNCVTKAEKVLAPTKPVPDTGSSGALSDKEQVSALTQKLQDMQQELMRLKAAGSNDPPNVRAKGPVAEAAEAAEAGGSDDEDAEVDKATYNAAKQKIRRMTRPRQNGSYIVPQHIVQKFDAAGTERKKLIKVMIENNMDKDRPTRQSL